MATKKNTLGELIREARTKAGLTQEKLAAKISGIAANDISKMERGDLVPSQDVLKQIAKLTGVTQSSLLEAAKTARAAAEKKADKTSGKTSGTSAGKTTGKTSGSTTGKTSGKTGSTTSSKKDDTGDKLTAAEKKLLEAYRKADSDTRKAAMKVLSGESTSLLDTILGGGIPGGFGDAAAKATESLLGNVLSGVLGK